MKLMELKDKIDSFIGIKSFVYQNKASEAVLTYLVADTNVVLFDIEVSRDKNNGWRFGAMSAALPDQWTKLCRMHRED